MNEVLKCLYQPILKAFDYKSRATRTQYWSWFGINALWYFYLNPSLFAPMIDQSFYKIRSSMNDYSSSFSWIGMVQVVVTVGAWVLPYLTLLSMTARRMRDADAKPWLFKAFATGHYITVFFLPLAFVLYYLALFAIPGLFMMAIFGVGCMITALKPSAETLTEYLPKKSFGERLKSDLEQRAQELANE